MYAGAGTQDLEARASEPVVAEWIAKYTEASGKPFPSTGAMLGRSGAEMLHRALDAAGPELTHESFIAAMESLDYEDVISGNHVDYSATDHTGGDEIFVSVVKDGSWVLLESIK